VTKNVFGERAGMPGQAPLALLAAIGQHAQLALMIDQAETSRTACQVWDAFQMSPKISLSHFFCADRILTAHSELCRKAAMSFD